MSKLFSFRLHAWKALEVWFEKRVSQFQGITRYLNYLILSDASMHGPRQLRIDAESELRKEELE